MAIDYSCIRVDEALFNSLPQNHQSFMGQPGMLLFRAADLYSKDSAKQIGKTQGTIKYVVGKVAGNTIFKFSVDNRTPSNWIGLRDYLSVLTSLQDYYALPRNEVEDLLNSIIAEGVLNEIESIVVKDYLSKVDIFAYDYIFELSLPYNVKGQYVDSLTFLLSPLGTDEPDDELDSLDEVEPSTDVDTATSVDDKDALFQDIKRKEDDISYEEVSLEKVEETIKHVDEVTKSAGLETKPTMEYIPYSPAPIAYMSSPKQKTFIGRLFGWLFK